MTTLIPKFDLKDGGATPAGAVNRDINEKLAEVVSVLDFGADPTGAADSAPAFRSALAGVAYGGTILIPTGRYLMNSAVNSAILDFTAVPNKGITWQGQGWTLKTGGSFSFGTNTGPSGSIIVIGSSISSTTDFYRQSPTDLVVGGTAFKDFAIVTTTGAYGTPHGQNGFNFDGANNGYFENLIIDNVFIDNFVSGSSIFVNGVGNTYGLIAGANIRSSKFMSFYGPNMGDSITIEKNTIGANADVTGAIGINWFNASGATNTRILNNNFVNFNGMILCNGGTKPIIDGNECEQNDVANTLGALISLAGGNGVVDTPTVTNNSIAQNSTVANYIPINIGNCNGALVSNNRTSTPTSYSHYNLTSDCSYALIEADNQAWIAGTVQNGVLVTDAGVKNMLRGAAWKSYTPTISAGTGTITSTTATGRYQLLDTRTLLLELDILITSAGTGAGTLNISLPNSLTAASYQAVSGKEVAVSGVSLSGYVASSSNTVQVTNYLGNTIIATNNRVVISAIIEIQ